MSRVADPHHLNADPDPSFQIQILLVLLIEVIRILRPVVHSTDPSGLHLDPPRLHYGPPRPLKLLNVDFNVDLDPGSSNADPDPALKNNNAAYPDPDSQSYSRNETDGGGPTQG